MRVLVAGSGGREHALAWKLAAETSVDEVVVAPGSDAIADVPGVAVVRDVDPLDPASVVRAARLADVDLVVVGPEAPLAAGVIDALAAARIAAFGPTRAAAALESSKAFCHAVAEAAGVRMARSRAFTGGQLEPAFAWIRELDADGHSAVLKSDGLAAGKGVIVTTSLAQALGLAPSFLTGRPADEPALVIEERLDGREASVIAICDGTRAVALPAARDHKRLCDADRGPNTGGMGAYSPLPDLPDERVEAIVEAIHRPMLDEMARRGTPFRGFLYAGLMLTSDGPALLECNVRLGDPEAQVTLPRLTGELAPVLAAASGGHLGDVAAAPLGTAASGAAVGIVLAAEGYPGEPRRGDPIEGLDRAAGLGALVFHAGTIARPNGGFGTNGGRVLTVVGRGADLEAARALAERAAGEIHFDGMQRRHDIGADVSPVPGVEPPSALAGVPA